MDVAPYPRGFHARQHTEVAQHQAEERGASFDPNSVSGPLTLWQIAGLGARIDG